MLKLKEQEPRPHAEGTPSGGPPPLPTNVLLQRVAEAANAPRTPPPARPFRLAPKHLAVILAVLGLAGWVGWQRGWFEPVAPLPPFDVPSQWMSGNGAEAAVIQCQFVPRPGGSGKYGYRLTVIAAGGRNGGRAFSPDRSGTCHVELRDPKGQVVLEKDMALSSLAPS
jgi:hypothetical protein